MESLFLKLLNMSITAGWLVPVVLLLRPLLKKAPKAILCVLWGMVALRLVCPFTFESVLSLIPSAETVPEEILYSSEPAIHTGIGSLNAAINPILSESLAPKVYESVNPMQVLVYIATRIWYIGMVGMVLYALTSYLRLRRRVKVSLHLQDKIYLCDEIDTPFILGILRPKIYLPSAMDGEQQEYVIAHEQAHLRRKDHWWKPLGFALLTVYWFHPLMWVAYILLCRDIELACDEKVIKEMDTADKKAYSEALLTCSMPRRSIAACPLAFGEVGVKTRIKSVLNYKKPAFWLLAAAVVVCAAVTVFFLTDPPAERWLPDYESDATLEGLELVLKEAQLSESAPYLKVDWQNRSEKAVDFGEMYTLQYKDGGEWVDCDLIEDRAFHLLGYQVKPGRNFEMTYNLAYYDLFKPGTYRLSANCSVTEGSKVEKYSVWLEFWLPIGLAAPQYEPVEMVYSNGSFSYVMEPENAPCYRFENGILYSKNRDATAWEYLGVMQPLKLKKSTFDDLFSDRSIPYYALSPKVFRKNNAKAWELRSEGECYILLQQKDDTAYLALGSKDLIRWMYRLGEYSGSTATVGGADGPEVIVTEQESALSKAIDSAILAHHQPERPDGYIHAVSHDFIGYITATSTPLSAYEGRFDDVTACVMLMYQTYRVEKELPVAEENLITPAVLRFRVDAQGGYELIDYLESNNIKTLKEKYPAEIDATLLDPWYYQRNLEKKCYYMAVETYSNN